jgi:hypothetical protein
MWLLPTLHILITTGKSNTLYFLKYSLYIVQFLKVITDLRYITFTIVSGNSA